MHLDSDPGERVVGSLGRTTGARESLEQLRKGWEWDQLCVRVPSRRATHSERPLLHGTTAILSCSGGLNNNSLTFSMCSANYRSRCCLSERHQEWQEEGTKDFWGCLWRVDRKVEYPEQMLGRLSVLHHPAALASSGCQMWLISSRTYSAGQERWDF